MGVLLSELRFQIEHIPGVQNVVADGLTKIFPLDLKKISPSVRYCFKDDSTQHLSYGRIRHRISKDCLLSSDSEDDEQEVIKAQDEDSEVKLQNGSAIFEKFHNSVVGHLGCDRTYKALGHNWVGMKEQLKKYIAECTICQNIKWQ